jgi:hypothetical protein
MTKEEYKQLDKLLGKLSQKLSNKRYCLIPYHLNEGVYIGVYGDSGILLAEVQAPSIEDAVNKIKIQ